MLGLSQVRGLVFKLAAPAAMDCRDGLPTVRSSPKYESEHQPRPTAFHQTAGQFSRRSARVSPASQLGSAADPRHDRRMVASASEALAARVLGQRQLTGWGRGSLASTSWRHHRETRKR